MKQKFKRLLSAILSIVLVIGGLQVSGWTSKATTASAADPLNANYIYLDPTGMTLNGNANWTSASQLYLSVSTEGGSLKNSNGTVIINDKKLFYWDMTGWDKPSATLAMLFTGNWNDTKSNDYYRTNNAPVDFNTAKGKVFKYSGSTSTIDNHTVYNLTDDTASYTGSTPTPTPGTSKTIYFDTTAYLPSGWGAAYIYLYNSNTGAISGPVAMTKVSNGFYSYSVDTSIYPEVIFKPNAGSDWRGQTSGQTIPANKNLFTCTYFNTYTSGTWGVYSTTTTGGEFPSNVTGKATFFDLYTDYDINNSVYGSDYSNQTKTGILRAFDQNVNAAISNYWKNALTDEQEAKMYPLYFNAFQPYFYAKGGTDNWWKSANDTGTYAAYEAGFAGSLLNFSWFVNRVLSADPDSNASLSKGQDGAVVQGLVNDTLNSDGNITAKGTDVVLPQFNSAFYSSNSSIGKQYETVEFPFAARVISNVKYYQFDSGANGSTYRDVVRMNEDGTLSYYDGSVNPEQVVNGIPGDSQSVDNHTPGFFPFNVPSDSSSATTYDSANNKLNYGFGMKLEIEFTMDSDGKVYTVDKDSKVPATFEFSGDDDVWVYVDGKLALDMGGAHGIATGTIDFSSLENGNDKIKATVAYVKGIHSNGTVITDLDTIYNTEQRYGDQSYINAYKDANAGLLTNVTKEIEFDASDATKIHTLTIFYEERGMYESNFKATFNLEQPTKVKVTNEVNVDNVNPAFQSATKAVAANDTFVYNFANGAKKTYVTQDDKTATVATDGKMTINDGQSATFVKQFDRDAELALSQSANSKYTTSWSFSDMDESGTINKPISASYESGRDSLTVSDGRVEGSETNKFLLENKNTEDDSVPARVLAAYIQNPITGNIAIEKKLEDGFESEDFFEFQVAFTQLFGSSDEAVLNLIDIASLTYNVYEETEVTDADGNKTTEWVMKSTRVIGESGVIKIQAGQRAVIANVPIDSVYTISEVSGTGYEVTDLTAAANNDTSVSTAGYKATGKVVSDADVTVYDLFTFTNDEVILKDAFLVELGKENTLSVIPNSSVDGTLTGDLKTIVDAYKEAKEANKTIGFVFIENGKPVVDENKKPVTEYTTGGVTYTVTYKDGEPVLTITPTGEQTSDVDSVKVKYQLVELDGNGSVSYTTDTVEDETVTTVDVVTPIITATNYLYQANDDIYVLDYGLDVDLADTSDDYGLFQNDTLANPSLTGTISTYWKTTKGASTATATASTTMTQNTSAVTGTYGTMTPADATNGFKISNSENVNPKVTYSMNKFLSNKDYFNYNVMLKKSSTVTDTQTSNRFRLNLTSNVTIMPASVVYYEDNFNATAANDGSAKIIYTNTTNAPTTGVTLVQSNNQSEQYGYDEAYVNGTGFSAGSATEMEIGARAYFQFTGTGFDILSRVSRAAGNLMVYVYDASKSELIYDEEAKTASVTNFAAGLMSVMTVSNYYENGDLYQVPVIHKDMDAHGTYIVEIVSLCPSNESATVYIDGIRIYNPLGTDGDAGYIDNEEGAEIRNIRDALFGKGFEFNYENPVDSVIPTAMHDVSTGAITNQDQLPAATLFIEDEDTGYYLSGKTVVEAYKASRYDSDIDLNDVANDMMTYAVQGPNNELYLDDSGYAIGFDTEAEADDSECTIQIGLKVVSGDSVKIQRQVSYNEWEDWMTVTSATEKYYVLDDVLDDDGNKDALSFAIRVEPGTSGIISVTNLKIKNYTLSALDIATVDAENETEALNPYDFVYKSGCKTGFTASKNATFTCKTPVGVEDIKLFSVNNSNEEVDVMSKSFKVVGTGDSAYQLWTVRFKPTVTQSAYWMRAYDGEGNYSQPTKFGKGVTW